MFSSTQHGENEEQITYLLEKKPQDYLGKSVGCTCDSSLPDVFATNVTTEWSIHTPVVMFKAHLPGRLESWLQSPAFAQITL